MEALHRELGEDNYPPCPNLREMVDAGYLGSKTGRGVFQYSRPRHADRAEKPVSMTFRGTKASTSRDAVTHPSLTDRLRALASGSRCRSSASNSRPACEPSPAPPCPPLGDSPAVWPAVPLRRPRGPLTDPERRPVGLLFADYRRAESGALSPMPRRRSGAWSTGNAILVIWWLSRARSPQ